MLIAFIVGNLFSTNVAEAGASISELQKQIKSLQKTIASQKKTIATQKETIASQKRTIATQKENLQTKDKQIADLHSKSAKPLNTKISYQNTTFSDTYNIGNTNVPLVLEYKGVKYAPVEAIGDLLKIKTNYYRSSNTVFFGKEPQLSYMSDILEPIVEYDATVDINKPMDFGKGIIYDKGYRMTYSGAGRMIFNLDNQYKKLTGLMKIEKQSVIQPLFIYIIADGKWYKYNTTPISDGTVFEVDLDVSNVSKLQLLVEGKESGQTGVLEFANVIIN